jgi:hypothetical protein
MSFQGAVTFLTQNFISVQPLKHLKDEAQTALFKDSVRTAL